MGGGTRRIPMSHRVLSPNYKYTGDNSGDDHPAMQLSGSIFGFLEEDAAVLTSPECDEYCEIQHEAEEDEETESPENLEDKLKFWETQRQNLHTTLFKTTSLEANIRNITKEVNCEIEAVKDVCSCSRPVSGACRSCRLREICRRLQNSGYNSAICKSKWKSSSDIPSGEHTFIDVIETSNNKKGEMRVIIDVDFRVQFEMKKGNEDYNRLVSKLPDVFVGKIERLLNVIKILSIAAKRCMKEKKMHLGPWRKQQYMKAKWVRVVERTTTTTTSLIKPLTVDHCSIQPTRAKTSMLTMDLLDNLSNFYATAVEVL